MFVSFDRLARGKQSIAVDIKKPEGLDIVRKMCSRADVLIEPFRPGSVSCAIIFRFMVGLWCLTTQQYFSYIVAISFVGGGNQSIRRKPPTCHKSLTNFITYCCIE